MMTPFFAAFLTSLIIATSAQPPPFQVQNFNSQLAAAGIQGCLTASNNADGAPAIIHNCNTEAIANRSLFFSLFDRENTPPEQVVAFGTKCLDVTGGVKANGTKLQFWTCGDNNPNQQWIYRTDSHFQWSGTDLCVDLTNGVVTDGNQLQVWQCTENNINQIWQGNPVPNTVFGPVEIVSTNPAAGSFCIVAESSINGAGVSLVPCSSFTDTFASGNISFIVPQTPLTGSIATFGGTKCLDVRDGSTANGNLLQVWDCIDGNTNQQFTVHSPDHITWAGKNKCLDLTNGATAAGTPIQIWDCIDGNTNQNWFFS